MKNYGLIPTSIMRWIEVRKLPTASKLCFLLTMAETDAAGVFRLDVDYFALDTGLEAGTIPAVFEQLAEKKLIIWDRETNEIFSPKFWSHNSYVSLKRGCDKAINNIQSTTIKREIIHKINCLKNKPNINQIKEPPTPSGSGEKSNSGECGGVVFENGLELSSDQVSFLERILSSSQKQDSDFLNRAAWCLKAISLDSKVDSVTAVFKARLKNSNFDDAGLRDRFLAEQNKIHANSHFAAHQAKLNSEFVNSIPKGAKIVASKKSASEALKAAKAGAFQ